MPVTRLVARPDDSQLAYSHGGRLGLLDAAMHELAAVDVAHDPRWVGFVGGQLATLDGDELVAYDLPSLTEATRCAVPRFRVHTPAASPSSLSLASRTTSSSVSNGMIDATAPKISSRLTRIPFSVPVKTVGW